MQLQRCQRKHSVIDLCSTFVKCCFIYFYVNTSKMIIILILTIYLVVFLDTWSVNNCFSIIIIIVCSLFLTLSLPFCISNPN